MWQLIQKPVMCTLLFLLLLLLIFYFIYLVIYSFNTREPLQCMIDRSTPQARQADVVPERAISTEIYVTTTPWHKLRYHPLDPWSGLVPPYTMAALSTDTLCARHHGRSTRWHVTCQTKSTRRTWLSHI